MKYSKYLQSVLILVLLVAVLFTIRLYSQEQLRNVDLQKKVQDLEQRLEEMSVALQQKEDIPSLTHSAAAGEIRDFFNSALPPRVPDEKSSQGSEEKSPIGRTAALRAERRLRRLESITVLSEEEKKRIEEMYREQYEGREPSETLEDILGSELAERIAEEEERIADQIHRERVKNQVYILSRKLGLSIDQEFQVEGLVSQIDSEIHDIFRSVMSSEQMVNTPNADPRKQRREIFEEVRKVREEKLSEGMRDILTDKQYNTFLEDRASRPPWGFGPVR